MDNLNPDSRSVLTHEQIVKNASSAKKNIRFELIFVAIILFVVIAVLVIFNSDIETVGDALPFAILGFSVLIGAIIIFFLMKRSGNRAVDKVASGDYIILKKCIDRKEKELDYGSDGSTSYTNYFHFYTKYGEFKKSVYSREYKKHDEGDEIYLLIVPSRNKEGEIHRYDVEKLYFCDEWRLSPELENSGRYVVSSEEHLKNREKRAEEKKRAILEDVQSITTDEMMEKIRKYKKIQTLVTVDKVLAMVLLFSALGVGGYIMMTETFVIPGICVCFFLILGMMMMIVKMSIDSGKIYKMGMSSELYHAYMEEMKNREVKLNK